MACKYLENHCNYEQRDKIRDLILFAPESDEAQNLYDFACSRDQENMKLARELSINFDHKTRLQVEIILCGVFFERGGLPFGCYIEMSQDKIERISFNAKNEFRYASPPFELEDVIINPKRYLLRFCREFLQDPKIEDYLNE